MRLIFWFHQVTKKLSPVLLVITQTAGLSVLLSTEQSRLVFLHPDYYTVNSRLLKIWDFKSAELLHTIQMEAPIAGIRYHQDNELLAVATDDLCISVIDIETQKVVREFWGHRNRITDFVSC